MKHATTKTTSIQTKAITAVMVAACALTAVSALAITSASAANEPATQVTQSVQTTQSAAKTASANAYTFTAIGETTWGYDWDYYIDSNCVAVDCKYDFNTSRYTFTVSGKYEGTANVELRYKTNDTTWKKHNVKLKVDAKGNVSKIG